MGDVCTESTATRQVGSDMGVYRTRLAGDDELPHGTRHRAEALLVRLVAAQEVEHLLALLDRLLDERADEHHPGRHLREVGPERRVIEGERVAVVVAEG